MSDRDFGQAVKAVNADLFSEIILPPGASYDISRRGSHLVPSFSGLEKQERILSVIEQLGPGSNALIVNGFETMLDRDFHAKVLRLVRYLSRKCPQNEVKLWGDFHLNGHGVEPIESMLAAGFCGVIAGPPFLESEFQRNVDSYYIRKLHEKCGSLIIGIPYIAGEKDLFSWYHQMGVDIAESSDAQATLELFRRAARDGRLKAFRKDWNRANCERSQALIGVDGIQVIPLSLVGESIEVCAQAKQVITTPLSKDFLKDARYERARFIDLMKNLPVPINAALDDIVLSCVQLPGKNAGTYLDQCLPKLAEIVEAFREVQQQFPESKIWKDLSVSVERPTLVSLARGLLSCRKFYHSEEDYLVKKEPAGNQLLINLRPGLLAKGQSLKDVLVKKLTVLCGQSSCADMKYEISGSRTSTQAHYETDSALHRLGMEGYSVLRKAGQMNLIQSSPDASGKSSAGLVDSAKHSYVINRSASAYAAAFRRVGISNPTILEPGSYQANGILPLIDRLQELGKKDPDLKRRLQEMVFSDFSQAALDTSEEVLGERHRSGINFKYLLLDSTGNVRDKYQDAGLLGRIAAARAINVLDAVGSDYIARIEGKFYKVATKTFLNGTSLEAVFNKKFYDLATDPAEDFKYQDYNITVEEIADLLNQPVDPENPETASVSRFLSLCQSRQVPEHRAIYLWKCIYESLEQDHDYIQTDIDSYSWVKDAEGNPLNHVLKEVLLSHSGNFMIPDSARAIGVLQGILPLLEKGGVFLSAQLTTSIKDSRATFHGWRSYGVTFAMPICWDLVKTWAESQGYKVKRTFGSQFDAGENGGKMTDTNSLIEFQIN